MNHKKYINYTTKEFILDDDFLKWVIHPDQENDRFWNDFSEKHPEKQQQLKEAVYLIKAFRADDPTISKQRLNQIYRNIRPVYRQERIVIRMLIKIAAVLLLLVSIGGLLYFLQINRQPFPFEVVNSELLEKGRVILPDGTINEFDTENTYIRQTSSNVMTINNDTVPLGEISEKEKRTAMTKIIIPYGQRSEIALPDGTTIWLNSGSQLSYPVKFTGNSREVYLSGEAFFDVKSNPLKPFHVITENIKIRVTGTRFNLTSYAGEQTTQAVLVSGKINAARNKRLTRTIDLEPGDRIVFNKQEENMEMDRVDVELYTSWVDGYLVFDNEPVTNIFKKLERYYNKNILAERLSDHLTFSGKLNLADELEKVLNNIAFSASFSVQFENDAFLIKQ